jgi:hypothetical protein
MITDRLDPRKSGAARDKNAITFFGRHRECRPAN